VARVVTSIDAVRARFTALQRPLAFFDGPGGTQVPDSVIDAIAGYLRAANANLGGPFETSRLSDELVTNAHVAAAGFLNATVDEVAFGANMTTMNFALSRAAGRSWRAGDEIVCTKLDHDGNISPWLELAHDKGLVVSLCEVDDECRLDLDHLRSLLTERTRVVAFPWASNAVGTVTPVSEVTALAHEAGALAWVDAVHYAPHGPIDVQAAGADVLLCSPYKFYGPPTMAGRVPTFLFNVDGVPAAEVAGRLGERGFGIWHADNWYCVSLGARLPEQSLRAGIAHYNTRDEVDGLLDALASF